MGPEPLSRSWRRYVSTQHRCSFHPVNVRPFALVLPPFLSLRQRVIPFASLFTWESWPGRTVSLPALDPLCREWCNFFFLRNNVFTLKWRASINLQRTPFEQKNTFRTQERKVYFFSLNKWSSAASECKYWLYVKVLQTDSLRDRKGLREKIETGGN